MAMHAPMTMSLGGAIAPTVDRVVASPLGAVIATLCPTLLIIGLCSRIVALPLLFEACALQGPDGPSPLHLYWAVLLGWIIVRGPGAISIDALLSRGLVSTAIPGTAALGRVTGAATRILEPWYRLALRLWIATAPLAVGATVLGSRGSAMREQLGPWLARYPQTMGAAPSRIADRGGIAHLGFRNASRRSHSRPRRSALRSDDAAGRTSLLGAGAGHSHPSGSRTIFARRAGRGGVPPRHASPSAHGPVAAACGRCRGRLRRRRRGSGTRRRCVQSDAGRPPQLSLVPAAALSGRDRRIVARRHRDAYPKLVSNSSRMSACCSARSSACDLRAARS